MPLTYMQCRDTKCTHNKVMENERANYMQTLKRKCSLAKNPSKQDVQAYSACAANQYNGSRLNRWTTNRPSARKRIATT